MSDEVKTPETEEAEAPKVDKRARFIITPEGERVNRTDKIRSLWEAGGMDRADILKYVRDECEGEQVDSTGKLTNDIPYQIVFAATKGLAGGLTDEQKEQRKAAKEAEREEKKAAKKAEKEAAKAAKAAEKAEAEEGEADEEFED